MPDIVILADDLSGAADCGIVFAEAGLDTRVSLGTADPGQAVAVLAIDGDTRSRSCREAVTETERLVRAHAGHGRTLFRKVDSTLRGHLAAELAATLAVRREDGPAIGILAPAFPATGRTTSGGHQHLDGVALEHTSLWRREGMRGRAHLPEMLEAAGLTAAVIGLELLRGPDLAAGLIEQARHHDVLVADVEQDADLALLAQAARALDHEIIWAGSAGLARHLVPTGTTPAARPPMPPLAGPILFVVGSASTVSRRQATHLAHQAPVTPLIVSTQTLRAGPDASDWLRARAGLRVALARGQDTLVMLGDEDPTDLAEGALLCRALAALIVPEAYPAAALVATGGETARALLDRMGATGLRLMGELEPGVPLSILEGARPIPIITKAGAFGTDATLLRCHAALRATITHPEPRP
jgi:4-hydroxythreonine-4-phosphate dehydrogenase